MKKRYTVSQDKDSGLWYAHMIDFSYIPVMGSFCERKCDAKEYAKMMNGELHKVEQIEARKKKEWLQEYGELV